MTSKAARHIELRVNSYREWVQDKTLQVEHVSGKINPADIFTEEMRDGAHFRCVRDSFMSHLSDFLSDSILAVHHASQRSPTFITPAAARVSACGGSSGYLSALGSSSFFRTLENISHLCSAGRHLLRWAHGFVPAHIPETFFVMFHPKIFPWESTFFFLLDARMGGVGLSLVHWVERVEVN
jgi:hypothetical protein